MNMMINVIAMLLSFAMMLTGAGGDGQPAQAKNLVLHNIEFTYNGETVTLPQALKLGVSTDGNTAVFDFGIDQNGEKLLPVQLGVSEEGVKALFTKSDVALHVTAEALNGLSEQASAMLEQLSGQMQQATAQVEAENPELMKFLTEEYLPAYIGLMEAAQDENFAKSLQEKAQAVLESVVDRGEGAPVSVEINDKTYALTEYSYTLESEQMAQLLDALFASDEVLKNYYDAMFKMYDLMPAESGLNGVTSYADLFGKTGLKAKMDITEQRSEDDAIEITDAVMTMDMSEMIQNIAAAQAAENGGEAEQVPEIPPMVMNIHAQKVDDVTDVTVTSDYEVEGVGVGVTVHGLQSDAMTSVDMSFSVRQGGNEMFGMDVFAMDDKSGFGMASFHVQVPGMGDAFLSFNTMTGEDGNPSNYVYLNVNAAENSFTLGFSLDVTDEAIEDVANGHEAAITLNELSEEALSKLGEDQTFQAAVMQVAGSMGMDAQKLMQEENLQKLMALFATVGEPATEVPDDEVTFEIDGVEYEPDEDAEDYDDEEYEEPEDDGVLPFKLPEFTWLPEGWSIQETSQDTAYDWADFSIGDKSGDNSVYVIFFTDTDISQSNYMVADDGAVSEVKGREITVNDFGEGNLSVTFRQSGVYCNLMVSSASLDLESIGKLVAGIQF